MSKKLLAFNISLLMILSTTLPGSLAFSEMSEEPSDALDILSAEVETSEDELDLEEKTALEEELALEEEILIEEEVLSQDQPLEVEEVMEMEKVAEEITKIEAEEIKRNMLYEKLMATKTFEEFDEIIEKTTDAVLYSLSEEEIKEIDNHVNAFEIEEIINEVEIVNPTVNFDNVAPLKDPVTGGNN